jgi:hypothetical protein
MPPDISLDDIDENAGETAAPEPAAATALRPPETPQLTATLPSSPETATAVTAKLAVAALPSTLKDAIAALKKAEALPHATKAQQAERDAQLARLRPHIARLQEGVPTPVLTAKALGNYHHQLVASAKRERLELLARSNPEIAEVLAECDRLKTELNRRDAETQR